MLWKLFATTFALIFIAELGDKTQLAVMARAASSNQARWVVFAAASIALVASTLVAVMLGGFLSRFNPRAIRLVAGGVFLLFGLLILRDAWRDTERETAVLTVPSGPLSRLILAQAAEFEKAAFADYHALAAKVQQPGLKRLLLDIANEEDEHFRRIQNVRSTYEHAHLPERQERMNLPERDALMHDVALAAADRPIVEHAIEHETATAGFYRELARLTLVPGLRNTFLALSEADAEHARRLRAWQERQAPSPDSKKEHESG